MSCKRMITSSVSLACGILMIGTATQAQAQFNRECCFLPADSGPCECYWPQYYYSASTGYCEEFIYGCCEGNENRFLTIEECETACVPTSVDCQLPNDVGPCDGICPRFYHNADTGKCEQFDFGCCEGNANNFLTQAACEATCPSGPREHASVPAVSEWGMIAMVVLMSMVLAIKLRQRERLHGCGTTAKS